MEATPPEHSTGSPGQRFWASTVTSRTVRTTVSMAKRAISAGGSPLCTMDFTLFSIPDREKVRPSSFTANPSALPCRDSSSSALPAGKGSSSRTPVRSMS